MYYTVYKITNKVNGKFYIGAHKTEDLDDSYMGSGKVLKRAIKKYGIENFIKDILHIFNNKEDMFNKEKELVILNEMSYNLKYGGTGGFDYVNAHCHEQRLNNGIKGSRKHHTRMKTDEKYKETFCQKVRESQDNENYKKIRAEITRRMHKNGIISSDSLRTKEVNAKRKETFSQNKHMQGERNSQFGTIWITNGIDVIKIRKEEFEEYNSLGYERGRYKK